MSLIMFLDHYEIMCRITKNQNQNQNNNTITITSIPLMAE